MHLVFVVVLGEGAMEMRIGLACYLPILVSIRLQKSAKFAGDSVQSCWGIEGVSRCSYLSRMESRGLRASGKSSQQRLQVIR